MEEQEVNQNEFKLRSVNSDIATHVQFINQSRHYARAWWLDFAGLPVSYGDIRPGSVSRMNTFLTHPWVFRDTRNGAKLLANLEEVYIPTPTEYEESGDPRFLSVVINNPVYSLQDFCLMLIRKLVRNEDYCRLDIPEALRQELRRHPHIVHDLTLLNSTRTSER